MVDKAKIPIGAANLAVQHPWGAGEIGCQLHSAVLHAEELRSKCPDGVWEPPRDVATQRGALGPNSVQVHPELHGVVVIGDAGDIGREGVGGHDAGGEGDGLCLGDVAGEGLQGDGAPNGLAHLNAPQQGVRECLGVACGGEEAASGHNITEQVTHTKGALVLLPPYPAASCNQKTGWGGGAPPTYGGGCIPLSSTWKVPFSHQQAIPSHLPKALHATSMAATGQQHLMIGGAP